MEQEKHLQMIESCDLPQIPEYPKYLTQWHLKALKGAARAIVAAVEDKEDATRGEINLAVECESLLTRIVNHGEAK